MEIRNGSHFHLKKLFLLIVDTYIWKGSLLTDAVLTTLEYKDLISKRDADRGGKSLPGPWLSTLKDRDVGVQNRSFFASLYTKE